MLPNLTTEKSLRKVINSNGKDKNKVYRALNNKSAPPAGRIQLDKTWEWTVYLFAGEWNRESVPEEPAAIYCFALEPVYLLVNKSTVSRSKRRHRYRFNLAPSFDTIINYQALFMYLRTAKHHSVSSSQEFYYRIILKCFRTMKIKACNGYSHKILKVHVNFVFCIHRLGP